MSNPLIKRKGTAGKSSSKSLTRRQFGIILNNINNSVKGYMSADDNKTYRKTVDRWRIIPTTEAECKQSDFTPDAANSLIFTEKLAKSADLTKNTSVPLPLLKIIPGQNCKLVVLGLSKDLFRYFEHNKTTNEKFILLAVDKWSEEINIKFVSCAINNHLQPECELKIAILIPKEINALMKYKDDKITPRITANEIFFFYKALFIKNIVNGEYVKTDDTFTYDILLIHTKIKNSSGGKSKKHKRKNKGKSRTIKKR